MLKTNAIFDFLTFSSETETGDFVRSPVHCFAIVISTRISFSAQIYIDIKNFLYIILNIESRSKKQFKCRIMEDPSFLRLIFTTWQ